MIIVYLEFAYKYLYLKLKLICQILIGQNIIITNRALNFKQYW